MSDTRSWVWSGASRFEERNAAGTLTKRFFDSGETSAGTNYFFVGDHLGSVREVTNSAGSIQAVYAYDLFGQTSYKAITGFDSDLQYGSCFLHKNSGMLLAMYRAYDPNLGRWLNRDPAGETAGTNLFSYVNNNPASFIDYSGLYPGGYNPLDSHGQANKCTRHELEQQMSQGAVGSAAADLDRGCIGLCSFYQGLGQEFPENAPGTKCFLHQSQARKRKCEECESNFVFAKQGDWAGGRAPNADPISGEVSNSSISNFGHHYNYVTFFPETNTYAWMNHGTGMGGGDQYCYTQPEPPVFDRYPHSIWCSTCVKKGKSSK